MKTKKFWLPVIVAVVVTPIALLLGIASAGVGHGSYYAAMVLFPYTMLSALVFDSITIPFILLAIIQFPLYGVALGFANEKERLGRTAILIFVLHGLALAVLYLLAKANFS